jgi:exosortase D (VPLPA-CTERM-specific)
MNPQSKNSKLFTNSRISIILLSILLIAAFGYLYKDVIINLVKLWYHDGNYSHGFFVPIIVGYIIWSKRKELTATPIKPFWPALVLLIIAGLILIAGQLTIHRFSKHISLFLMIFALTFFVFGKGWSRKLLLPLAFFIFMFPLPQFMRRGITEPLQLLSSYISVNFLSLLNFPVFREGNVIEIPDATLSVVEACSGLRSLVALTFLAAIAGYFVLKSNWKRLVLFLCAFPIAIMLNWVRITGTVLLADSFGIDAALGFFHEFSGLIIFGTAIILIAMIMLLLGRKKDQTESHQEALASKIPAENYIKPITLIASTAILVLLVLYSNSLFSFVKGPPINLNSIPSKIGSYEGKDGLIDPSITEYSSVTQDRSITYYHQDSAAIGVYLGYYRMNKDSSGFFHGTDSCLPGSGWNINKKEKISFNLFGHKKNNGKAVKYVSTKAGKTQIMVTWVQAGETIGTGTLEFRFKFILDVLTKLQYNDATKIMAQTLLGSGESEEEATARLITFLKLFYPNFVKLTTQI